MKETGLGTLAGLQLTVIPAALVGSIGLGVIVFGLMAAVFNVPIISALLGGLIVVALHWFADLVHQLGHAWAARRVGYPMVGVRFGTLAVFSTALYPADEPTLPARIHIRRALGGPIFSAWLSSLAFLVILMVIPSADAMWRFVLWFFFLENLFVLTLQVFIPLGFNDGATIWHYLRQRDH
jgi:hypothetical protein